MQGDVRSFQRVLGRQHMRCQFGGVVVDDLGGGEYLEVLQCRDQLAGLGGERRDELPPTLISARMLPAAISSGSTAQGHSLMNA